MAYKSDPEFFNEALLFYKEGKFEKAYALMTEAARRFPDEGKRIYEWRFDLAARLGKPELSEAIFKEALDAGYFYGERTLRTDEDLKEMQGRPVFECTGQTRPGDVGGSPETHAAAIGDPVSWQGISIGKASFHCAAWQQLQCG